jgi:CheY-like chemotaxis protein
MAGLDATDLEALLQQQESLREIIESISSELDLRLLLTRIVRHACELLGAENGTIGLVDEHRDVIRTEAAYRMPPDELGTEFPPGVGLFGHILLSQQPLILNRYGDLDQPTQSGLLDYAVVSVPIVWRDQLIGVFGLARRRRVSSPTRTSKSSPSLPAMPPLPSPMRGCSKPKSTPWTTCICSTRPASTSARPWTSMASSGRTWNKWQHAVTTCATWRFTSSTLDLVMPEMDGVEAMRRIRGVDTTVQVLVLTSFADDQLVRDAIQAGAISYLLKDVLKADLLQAIRAAAQGRPTLHPEAQRRLMQQVTGFGGYSYGANTVRSLLPMMEKLGVATADEVGIDTLADRLRDEVVSHNAVIATISLISGWTRTNGAKMSKK